MRVIGQIAHPSLKISVFRNDNRLSVKFENTHYETTFKMGDDDRFRSVADVEQFVDAVFLQEIQGVFQQMHAARLSAMARQFPAASAQEFEEII